MKLRMQGNSIRFRLLRSEVTKFIEDGRIAETTNFGATDGAAFTYALEWNSTAIDIVVRYRIGEAALILPKDKALSWAQTEQVGIYSVVNLGDRGGLTVTVEKDFACLDLSDAENVDTFPNPHVDAAC